MSFSVSDLVVHAVQLLALAVAPPFFSPAPAAEGTTLGAIASVVLLAAVVIGAGRLRLRPGGRVGLGAAVLIGAAVAAALVAADVFRGDRAPIGRGALFVAVPLWAGLALVAGAVAEQRYGERLRRARLLAMALVAAVFGGLVAGAAGWLFSPEKMWIAALRRNGDDAIAVEALTRAPLRDKRYDAASAILARCLAANPGACACLAQHADVAVRTGPKEQALAEARAAFERCPASAAARATAAEALAMLGDAEQVEQAEQAARAGLDGRDDGRLRYALALALDRRGGHLAEALDQAQRAVNLGAGRDAAVTLGSLAIRAGDLDTAEKALGPIVAADPGDAIAQYDLALVADRRNDYNRAREGYLAALRADPQQAPARNNLVYLTLRRGAFDEARHHAKTFAVTFPDDPRGAGLVQMVEEAARKAAIPQGPGRPVINDGAGALAARPLVSIVSPCFDEVEVIGLFHRELCAVVDAIDACDFELVYVDDGSDDGTLDALNAIAAADARVRVCSFSRNFGHQIALTAGLDHAGGDAIVMIDSDLQHPPSLIPAMIAAWRGGVDVVSAVRRDTERASLFKKAASRGFYVVLNLLSTVRIPEGAADFCLLSRRTADTLRGMRERHRFLRGMISWAGYRRAFLPYTAAARAAGQSKYTLVKMVRMGVDAILSFSTAPIGLASRVGVVVVLAGFGYLAWNFVVAFRTGMWAPGWASLIAVVMVLGGTQILFIGLIGQYLARAFEELKGRPLYVLKQEPPKPRVRVAPPAT